MPAPRKYPLELRERAVRMYRAAEPKPVIRRFAEDLGVRHEALRNWIRQAEADAGERTAAVRRAAEHLYPSRRVRPSRSHCPTGVMIRNAPSPVPSAAIAVRRASRGR
jgi:transposase-like protein